MRTLKLHFPHEALPTLDTYLKQTKEARVFRRAQAVREVVKGQRLQTVSDALHLASSALRKWVHRFANQGIQGDETILWRFALPRAGWWRKARRTRRPIRPLPQSHSTREESLKRPAWLPYRSRSRLTSGVLLRVIGAVQYGTSQVFYKVVPHFEAQELRQYLHQVMATFRKAGQEVVMVVDRSGSHRAHQLDATCDHYHGTFRFHFFPAHCGHHLNPIEGFWRVLQERIGAGRCFPDLHQLYHRTRRVLMAHQERPISTFHW